MYAATNYSFGTQNKKAAEAARKDCLFEQLGQAIESRGLLTRDIRQIDPAITATQVSYIRQGMRSGCSLDRIEHLARGLGLISPTYDPCVVAA